MNALFASFHCSSDHWTGTLMDSIASGRATRRFPMKGPPSQRSVRFMPPSPTSEPLWLSACPQLQC